MSIREDARIDRLVRDSLGYDPNVKIKRLEDEIHYLRSEVKRLKRACEKEFSSVQTLDAENTRLKLDSMHGTEGRRLFNLCLNHGAIPGQVHQWLKQRLEGTPNGKC